MPEGYEEFEGVTCTQDTDNACLCVVNGEQVWIPKSQIHDDSEVYEKGTSGRLIISEWICKQKDLV